MSNYSLILSPPPELVEQWREEWEALPQRHPGTLEAPTLLERAMKGDVAAAKQFLHEAGFTDKQGYFLPQYQPRDNPHD